MWARMMGNKRSRYSLLGWPRGRLLALLLVGALLLCHGVFGVLHRCSDPSMPMHQDHEHLSFMEKGTSTHEHTPCHAAGAEYFAVLFAAFLGLVLGLLLTGTRLWASLAAPLTAGRRFAPLVFHPPRGPTLPVLQVFRL